MSNSIALITKYTDQLDEKFVKESVTGILEVNSTGLDFVSSKTLKVPKITLEGLGDYSRANGAGGGYPTGDVGVEYETLTLSKDRAKEFEIDAMDSEETAGVAYGRLQDRFMKEKVYPEVDAYRLSKISGLAGTVLTGTISANTVISAFSAAEKAFEDNEVSIEPGTCVWFVSTEVNSLFKTSTELTRHIDAGSFNVGGIDLAVKLYDGNPIVVVPKPRFYDGITLSATNGWARATGSVEINFMLVSLLATLPVKKHEKVRVFAPDVNQTKDAWKFQYRLYHDIFVPDNKTVGIYVSKKAANYTIAFDANGGSGTMANLTAVYGTAIALTANTFTYSAHTFSKWNTKADGSGTDYAGGASVTSIGDTGSTVTLYAQWTAA
jgi:hypothetical protein